MLRTILWFAHFGTSLACTIPKLYKVKCLEEKEQQDAKNDLIHKTTSNWAMAQVKMSGSKVTVFGEENVPKDIPVVFISNHQGNFDIPILMAYINKPKGFVAKVEIKKIPIVHNWMEHIHCVFMDRSNLRQSAQTIVEAIQIIKKGHSLVIFPEGTRSKGNQLGEFKAGSFKLATKSKAPIIPVTIKGSYKIMEHNGNKIKPASIEVHIHPIVETAHLTKEEMDILPSKVKSIIESKL